jgi:hypothetical protein
MLKQIGNAVPPLLGRAIATVALRALQKLDGEADVLVVGSSAPSAIAASLSSRSSSSIG